MKKRITNAANDSGIDAIINNAPIENIHFIDRCMEITEQVFRMLDARNWKQKDLAVKMNKSEAEISKLLSGSHNLTIRTIAHIETILEENIILTKAGIDLEKEKNASRFVGISRMNSRGAISKIGLNEPTVSVKEFEEILGKAA